MVAAMVPRTVLASLACVLGLVVQVDALDEACIPKTETSARELLDTVAAIKNTLGYVDLDHLSSKLGENVGNPCTFRTAKIVNRKGYIVSPSARGAQAAVHSKKLSLLESSCPGFGLCADISDGGDPDVWPISTLTYMLVPTNATDWEEGCDRMKALHDYVKWILESDAASAVALEASMATMPPVIAERALQIIDEMQCHDPVLGVHKVRDRSTSSKTLQGTGSSLQANLQTQLTNAYFQQNFVSVSYTSTDSDNGMASLRARENDFAGTDIMLDMQDSEFIRRGMRMIPVVAAAIGVVFNVDKVDELVISRSTVDRLFTGEAFSWRDPALLADNPDVAPLLPDEAVIRVIPASDSTTTAALTKALFSFAGHSTPAHSADYSAHILGGSSLPAWPAHPQPYPGDTVCRLKECIDVVCDPGYHMDVDTGSCVACELGTFSATRGQNSACTPCPAGSYTNTVGNSRCVQCDDQKYQDEEGQQMCKPCPIHTVRFSTQVLRDGVLVREQAPGVSAGECKCVEGYWLPASVDEPELGGQDCVPCPEGAACLGFPDNVPEPKRGFWGREEHPQQMFECAVGACPGGFECRAGHKSRKCAEPAEGYFTIGELWFFQCPAPAYRAVFTIFGVLSVVAVWVLVHLLSLKYDAFCIAFLFFQSIGIISKFRLRWHPNLNIVLIALRVINFDVDFFGPQCLIPGWNAASAFYTQLLLPGIVVALYALFFTARKRLRDRFGARSRQQGEPMEAVVENKGYLRSPAYSSDDLGIYLSSKGTTYLIMMFHTLAARAFAVFVCETDADGEQQYLKTAPSLECWTTSHIVMVAAAVVYIVTIVCGVPLWLLWQMLKAKREDKLCDFTVTVSYWFLFAKFKAAFPFWELVLLLRRFVLVLILVFIPHSMLQAALALACLNAFLYLHLTHNPFKDSRVGLLDSFGLCCSMAYAVCGMLFYPSLDDAFECVGSANLDELGEQCGVNRQLKEETSTVLLLLLLFTLLAALHISFQDIRGKMFSAAAAKKIEADKKWYGKDKLFKAVRGMPKDSRRAERIASICRTLQEESKAHMRSLRSEASEMLESLRDVTEGSPARARKTVEMMLGMRFARSQRKLDGEEHDFANPSKLNLCDMLEGDCLHSWHKSLSTLSEKELAVRLLFAEEGEGQSMRQELAYMDLELWVPAFAVRHELASGYFSNSELSRVLRELVEGMPELINFLAMAEAEAVQSLSNFLNAFTIFSKNQTGAGAFHPLIAPVYRGQVVHWLMCCSADEQHHFLALFRALSGSAGGKASSPWTLPVLRLPRSWSSAAASNRVQPDIEANAPRPADPVP